MGKWFYFGHLFLNVLLQVKVSYFLLQTCAKLLCDKYLRSLTTAAYVCFLNYFHPNQILQNRARKSNLVNVKYVFCNVLQIQSFIITNELKIILIRESNVVVLLWILLDLSILSNCCNEIAHKRQRISLNFAINASFNFSRCHVL